MSKDEEDESVRQYFKAFTDAVTGGRYDQAIDMMTDDAVFWTANYPAISGKAAMKAAYDGLSAYTFHMDFEFEEIQVCGEWAFVRGYENITLVPKDGKGRRLEITKRRALSILRRQTDGTWKTARGMTNFDSPQPSPSAEK